VIGTMFDVRAVASASTTESTANKRSQKSVNFHGKTPRRIQNHKLTASMELRLVALRTTKGRIARNEQRVSETSDSVPDGRHSGQFEGCSVPEPFS
jgi:hypothetical protein